MSSSKLGELVRYELGDESTLHLLLAARWQRLFVCSVQGTVRV